MARKEKIDLVHMSNAQILETEKDINGMQAMLDSPLEHVKSKITDRAAVEAEIKKKRKLVETHAPKKYRGANANKMLAKARKLEKIIQDAMPKQKDYFQSNASQKDSHLKRKGFEDTVNQQIAFQTDPKVQRAVRGFKHIMRRIDPQDPTIANIEMLRR